MRRITKLLLLAALPLCACAATHDAIHGPKLDAMAYPPSMSASARSLPLRAGAQDPSPQAVAARDPIPEPASANSLWRSGARAFFIDQRASRVGDILTVSIEIDDSATLSNASGVSKTSSTTAGIPHLFGIESAITKILPNGFDASKMIDASGTSTAQGTGSVARKEKISLTVAAVVTQVLPNGNLVIQGSQEVKTNDELRELTVSGIARPEDISAANTIKHSQIAEARIYYGGRGDQSRVQKVPIGQSLLQQVNPF